MRAGARPARRGRPSGRAARRAGTTGARWRAPRRCAPPPRPRPAASPARACLPAGSALRWLKDLSQAAPARLLVFHPLQKSGFRGLFSPRSRNQVPQGRKHPPVAAEACGRPPPQGPASCRARAAARLRSPGLAAAPAGPGTAVTAPGRGWSRAAGQDTPRDGPLVYLACTCAGQRPDVPGRQRLAGGAARRPRPAAPPAGRGYIPGYNVRTARPGGLVPSRPRRPRGPRVTPRWPQSPRWCRGRRPRPGRGRRWRAGRCGACR